MLTIRTAAAAVALTLASSALVPAHAQLRGNTSQPSTSVGGNVEIRSRSAVQVATVVGNGSTARADQCSVFEDTHIGGNLTMECRSAVQVATVVGNNSHASATQGGVGVPMR